METFRLSVDCNFPNLGIVILSDTNFLIIGRIPFPSFPNTDFFRPYPFQKQDDRLLPKAVLSLDKLHLPS